LTQHTLHRTNGGCGRGEAHRRGRRGPRRAGGAARERSTAAVAAGVRIWELGVGRSRSEFLPLGYRDRRHEGRTDCMNAGVSQKGWKLRKRPAVEV
jgi:hypothetical protein